MAARKLAIEELNDASRRRAAILDSAMDGIITLTPDGKIEGLNRAARRMFGLTDAMAIGKDVGILYAEKTHPGYAEAELASMELESGGAGVIRHGIATHRDGRTFPVDVAITSATLTEGRRYVAVVRDVTEREKVEQLKSEFVSTVSHELRTPLTSIAGSLGLLASGLQGDLAPNARRLVEIAHRNSERLVRLVSDILDIQKLEAGAMSFELKAQPLRPIIEQAVQEVEAYSRSFDVDVQLLGAGSDACSCLLYTSPSPRD